MPIKIIITSDEQGLTPISPDNPIQDENSQKASQDKKVSGKMDAGQAMLVNFMKNQAKSWIKAGINTYTKFTGKGYMQEKIDNAVEIASSIGSIAIAGASFGPAGAFVAFAGITANYSMQEFNKRTDIKIANRQTTFMREGMGNIVTSGGRYGA